jgi:hypothetical protein
LGEVAEYPLLADLRQSGLGYERLLSRRLTLTLILHSGRITT